jgi:hypothetical protein
MIGYPSGVKGAQTHGQDAVLLHDEMIEELIGFRARKGGLRGFERTPFRRDPLAEEGGSVEVTSRNIQLEIQQPILKANQVKVPVGFRKSLQMQVAEADALDFDHLQEA